MCWQTTPMSKRVALFAIPIFQPVSFSANTSPNSFVNWIFAWCYVTVQVFSSLLIYYAVYIFPSSAIDYILKTILLQNTFCLTASVSTSTKYNDAFLVFEFC